MDVMSFLKTVPAVIGIAGLLAYFMRARALVSDHELVTVVNRVRNSFLLIRCGALIMLSVWLILRPAPRITMPPFQWRQPPVTPEPRFGH